MEQNNSWEKVDIGLTEMIDWENTKSISGKYVECRSDVGANNSNIYVVEQADGSKVSFWGNVVLDSRFKIIELGTTVKVDYKGRIEGKNGRSYKSFDVFTKK